MQAVKITPPAGMVIDAYIHAQGIGPFFFDGIRKGCNVIIGTVGRTARDGTCCNMQIYILLPAEDEITKPQVDGLL